MEEKTKTLQPCRVNNFSEEEWDKVGFLHQVVYEALDDVIWAVEDESSIDALHGALDTVASATSLLNYILSCVDLD